MPRYKESQPAWHHDIHIKQDLVGHSQGRMGKHLESGSDEIDSSEGHGSDGSSGSPKDLVSRRHGGASDRAAHQNQQNEKYLKGRHLKTFRWLAIYNTSQPVNSTRSHYLLWEMLWRHVDPVITAVLCSVHNTERERERWSNLAYASLLKPVRLHFFWSVWLDRPFRLTYIKEYLMNMDRMDDHWSISEHKTAQQRNCILLLRPSVITILPPYLQLVFLSQTHFTLDLSYKV